MKIKLSTIIVFSFFVLHFGKNAYASILPNDDSLFSISIGCYNHAEMLGNGEKVICVENGVLSVLKFEIFTHKETILFRKNLDLASVNLIRDIRLDTLCEYYFNYCVMPSSGDEYHVLINSIAGKKEIYLHHYYHQQVERLIVELDKHLPKELRMKYLNIDNEQSCDN